MSGGININVSGGQAQFGNLVQGDGNTASSELSLSVAEAQAFDAVMEALNGRLPDVPQHEIEELKAEITAIKAAAKDRRPTRWGSIGEALKVLKETHGWAAPLLKPLIAVLAPGLAL